MISNKLLLKLQQRLSPQQIQLMKLLQLPTIALEQRIKEELEINPTLEEYESEAEEYEQDSVNEQDEQLDLDIYPNDDEIISYKNNYKDKPDNNLTFISESTFYEELISQLQLQKITEKEKLIGLELIGNIDEAGYLSRGISSMVDDFAFRQNIEVSEDEIESVLNIIQTFDPSGIGARDLKECLFLQLQRKEETLAIKYAKEIIKTSFDMFMKKQYSIIENKLKLSTEQLQEAINEIIKLNPKPGNSSSSQNDEMFVVVPDFILWQQNSKVEFQVNKSNKFILKTSHYYENLLKDLSSSKSIQDKETVSFLRDKLDSAKVFIDSLNKRNDTLWLIMDAIVKYQGDYFIDGEIQRRKPMRLVDIADRVGLDISTISRVVSNKYVQTHFGIFLLKDFFSNYMLNDEGEAVSTDAIKDYLLQCIENEDKTNPLTDDQLVDMLTDKGYKIARRTVAKYREVLDIPIARLRKSVL